MSHEKDREHPAEPPPRDPKLASNPTPDRKRDEHPSIVPREPVDPKTHPSRH